MAIRANFNLFVRNANGTLASESSIIRYSLSEREYCEWVEYTTRNNLDAPGESVMTTYDRNGFTAVIMGKFTDHWLKIH